MVLHKYENSQVRNQAYFPIHVRILYMFFEIRNNVNSNSTLYMYKIYTLVKKPVILMSCTGTCLYEHNLL